MNRYNGLPVTLGNAAAAVVPAHRLVPRLSAPDRARPAEMAERYGGETAVRDGHSRLVCSQCGSRRADMVVTCTEGR